MGKNKKKIVVAGVIILLVVVALIIFLICRKGIKATTMRILRLEGTVTMEENGAVKAVKADLRLKSGNSLDTSTDSLVSIGLDDTKIVTLDQLSRAEFNQKGKYLNLNLTKGSLFFEVDKPLADDESFEIATSTMIVGIRGTSGWVSVSGEHESLIITDGKVHVIGTNPVTGEVKVIDVKAGQRVTVYLYNDREVDSIMFELEDITERDLPEFVLRMLRENPELLDKVVGETGWDKPWILGLADAEEPVEETETKPEQSNQAVTDQTENNPEPVADAEPEDTEETEPVANVQNDEELPPVAVPTPTALERQIEEALAKVTSVNPDGTYSLNDGTEFDPDYYGRRYPDVIAVYGDEAEELLAHYVAHGQEEGRFANQQEEDDKLLADMIANAPAPSNNNTNTNTGTSNSRPHPAQTQANTVTITSNANVTYNGMIMSYSNGKVIVNSSQNSNVTLPGYLNNGTKDIELNLSDFEINAGNITQIDASEINPKTTDMAALVQTLDTNDPAASHTVENGLVSVYSRNLAGSGLANRTGLCSNITTGQGQDSIDALKLAYNEMRGQSSPTIIGINYGSGWYDDGNVVQSDSFGIASDNTVLIGSVEFTNTSINWNGANGPTITAHNGTYNYDISGIINDSGF